MECDRLVNQGRHPDAALEVSVGFLKIDIERAIPACRAAMSRYPLERRFAYLLGRSFDRAAQFKLARKYYGEAGRRGDPFAMLALATLAVRGHSGPVNLKVAAGWVRKAAATRHPEALARLSRYYRRGLGLKYNPSEAFRLASAAAAAGWPFGLSELSYLHKHGIGTPKDRLAAQTVARRLFRAEIEMARRGDPVSMARIGWLYNVGDGVPRDRKTAIAWLRKAEQAGNSSVRHTLGWMFARGLGIAKDAKLACDYYETSAARLKASSMNNLGVCFRNGTGREKNYARAREWFEKASKRGNPYAPRNLAKLYEDALGVKQDLKKAVALYRLAAERGHPGAMLSYGWHLDKGTGGAKPDPARACDWYERSAARDNASAINNLALCYEGRGRPKNLDRSIRLLERAAARGNALATRNLAIRYDEGRGVKQNHGRANILFSEAASSGSTNAMVRLGYNIFHGQGIAGDPETGCDWFEKAADKGSGVGANNLASCFMEGEGREQDTKRALELFNIAIKKGSSLAMRNLAQHYISGTVIKKDIAKANQLFKKAADAGDAVATYRYAFNLFSGYGVKADQRKACGWFIKAYGSQSVRAAAGPFAGHCWERGIGQRRSRRKAFKAYEASATSGSMLGMQMLARAYDEAIGVKRSGAKSAHWLRKSLAAGNTRLAKQLIAAPHAWHVSTRKALQKSLKADGHYAGKVDGRFTALVDDAIWQHALRKPGASGGAAQQRLLKQEFARVPLKGAPKGVLVRICKRASPQPQRLIVINHGLTTVRSDRRKMRPEPCGGIAEFFAERGYVVAFPLRRGYGETAGRFFEDARGRCSSRRYIRAGREIARDIGAVVQHLIKRPDVRAKDVVVMGHSGGGWGTVALASKNPDAIAGYINFSGGHGTRQGVPGTFCPKSLTIAMRSFGKSAAKPSLWIYVKNDSFIGPSMARRMFRAFNAKSRSAKFVLMPRFENEGHNLFQDDAAEIWGPVIHNWMKANLAP